MEDISSMEKVLDQDRAEIDGLWAELQQRIKAFRKMEVELRGRQESAKALQRQVQTRFKTFEDHTKIGARKKRTKESKGKGKEIKKDNGSPHSLPQGWKARYKHLFKDMLRTRLLGTSEDAIASFLKQKKGRIPK